MPDQEFEDIQIQLLIQAIFLRYGYDFRKYSQTSLKRRILNFAARSGFETISAMIPALIHDAAFGARLMHALSITVSEMFRDPPFFKALRTDVIPYLKTYPFIRIWHAGCSTGEEVYSLAIVLKEAGIYNRATIFATDFNDMVLKKAGEGIYPLESIRKFTESYLASAGKGAFSQYYRAGYDAAIMDKALKRNITFANHNLVSDGVFSETHLILCRNVLIYFDKELQCRALKLFSESLVHGGLLALGSRETIQFTPLSDTFKTLSKEWKIYQKKR